MPGSTFAVTKTQDTNDGSCDADCSLREAVIAANQSFGTDSISVPNGIYELSLAGADEPFAATGDLDIMDGVTITGAGAGSTLIMGNEIDRIFEIATSADVTISNLAISGGRIDNNAGGGLWIYSPGITTLVGVDISGNSAQNGGGIYTGVGQLIIRDSTIRYNDTPGQGGGIQVYNGAVILENTTLSSNSATGGGGGGGIYNYSWGSSYNIIINNTTIVNNYASIGSAISNYIPGNESSLYISNSIIANNIGQACTGISPLYSLGYNLFYTSECPITGSTTGNIYGQNPLLTPLQNNGGPTPTNGLPANSPAVNGGSPAAVGSGSGACASTDQRGIARPVAARCDIGAYELTAGATIVGNVLNPFTRENFPWTAVTLEFGGTGGSPAYSTETDALGIFSFMDVPPGTYLIKSQPLSGWVSSEEMITVSGSERISHKLIMKKVISLLAPADMSDVESPDLCWEKLTTAAQYNLQVFAPGSTLVADLDVSSTCLHLETPLVDGTAYSWSLASASNQLEEEIGLSNPFQFTYHSAAITETINETGTTLVTSWDQAAEFSFPAGSFQAAGEVVYQPLAFPAGSQSMVILKAYDLSTSSSLAEGAVYQAAYQLSGLESPLIDRSTLGFYYWDDDAQEWVKDPTSQVDFTTMTISASPDRLASWMVLGKTHKVYLPLILR